MEPSKLYFERQFAKSLYLIQEMGRLTDKLGAVLVDHQDISPFAPTAVQFALIARETPNAIIELLRRGYLGQPYVLLRWYLEMAHLSYYLWQNPDRHSAWLLGKDVKPGSVRKFMRKEGFPDWGGVYDEWSGLVHGSAKLLLNYHKLERLGRKRSEHEVIIGNALVYLMWYGQKTNYVLAKLLQDSLGNSINHLARRYVELDDKVSDITRELSVSSDPTVDGKITE